jgi:hypothetical protein
MPDLSQFGTPDAATPPPPAATPPAATPPQQGGGLSQFGTPDLSQFGTPDQTQQPQDHPYALTNLISNYVQGVRQRNAGGVVQGIKNRLSDLNTGEGRNLDRSLLTILQLARTVDQSQGIGDGPQGHPLDRHIGMLQNDIQAANSTDPERAANIQMGDDATNLLQYLSGEAGVKALDIGGVVDSFGPIAKALKSSPIAAKVLRTMVEQGVTGSGMAAVQGGDEGDILMSGVTSALTGGLVEAPGARATRLGNIADELQPLEKDIRGNKFTVLKSELRGPNGESLATPRQTAAADISGQPAIRAERQQAFKGVQTSLAQDGIRGALTDANNVMSSSDIGADVRQTTPGGDWRYVDPNGSMSLTEPQARVVLDDLKQRWLAHADSTPAQDTQYQQAIDDIQDQLKRKNSYDITQPQKLHDVDGIANATDGYGDAAAHLDAISKQTVQRQMLPEALDQYNQLATERQAQQDIFNNAKTKLIDRENAEQAINDLNGKMEQLVGQRASYQNLPDRNIVQALKEQKLANGFKMLDNTMDKHFTYTEQAAQTAGAPRTATNIGSLAADIEKVKARYGDVLNPAIGDKGLDHINEIGQYMDMPEGREHVNNLYGNLQVVLRKHLNGVRNVGGVTVGAGGIGTGLVLSHIAGHLLGLSGAAGALGLGGLTAEAASSMRNNRMAIDAGYARAIRARLAANPAFASRFLFGARNMPASRAAPLLASQMTSYLRGDTTPPAQPQQGDTNAPSQ